jgi:hypothetical protein
MFPSFRNPLVVVALAVAQITVACGQQHQVPAGPTGPGSAPPSVSPSELPPFARAFPAVPSGSGLNGIYKGHSPFALVYASGGEAHTVWLEIARRGNAVGGDWYVQGSCCEGGVVNGTFDDATGSGTFGTLKLRLFSIDFDLGLDAALTSADGSSFAGQIFSARTMSARIAAEAPVG